MIIRQKYWGQVTEGEVVQLALYNTDGGRPVGVIDALITGVVADAPRMSVGLLFEVEGLIFHQPHQVNPDHVAAVVQAPQAPRV